MVDIIMFITEYYKFEIPGKKECKFGNKCKNYV